MVSTTDSEAWNLEVERAAPKLKVTVRADGRDWRSHLEQVWNYVDYQGKEQYLVSHICKIGQPKILQSLINSLIRFLAYMSLNFAPAIV